MTRRAKSKRFGPSVLGIVRLGDKVDTIEPPEFLQGFHACSMHRVPGKGGHKELQIHCLTEAIEVVHGQLIAQLLSSGVCVSKQKDNLWTQIVHEINMPFLIHPDEAKIKEQVVLILDDFAKFDFIPCFAEHTL